MVGEMPITDGDVDEGFAVTDAGVAVTVQLKAAAGAAPSHPIIKLTAKDTTPVVRALCPALGAEARF